MRKHEAYPSKYTKAEDLSGPTLATARSVKHEPMFDGTFRPVIYFDGLPKGVVINATNADVLYGIAGTDDDVDWAGLTVELYTEMVRSPRTGKTGPAIRFRLPQAKARKQRKHTEADPPPNLGEHLDDEVPLFEEDEQDS